MFKNRRRVVSYAFLAVAVTFMLAALLTGEGQVTSGVITETRTFSSPNPQIPTIAMTLAYTLKAKGSISAENPIEIKITISKVNVSNLLDYYQAVGFLGAFYNGPQTVPSNATAKPASTAQPQNQTYGFLKIEGEPDGTYTGASALVWQGEMDVYTFLIPQAWYPWKLTAGPDSGASPVIHVSAAADTMTWQYNEANTRLTLVMIGFGFLLLQPVAETVYRWQNGKDKSK